MVDKAVGNAGTLRITDDGSTVRFYVLCSDPSTSTGGYSWYGTVNGVGVGGTVSLPSGFGSRLLGAWSVGSSQTVGLGQNDTGTWGLGGGATVYASIFRATVPPSPTPYSPDQATPTSLRFRFQSRGDGGSPVTSWAYQYSTTANFSSGNSAVIASTGTSIVTGLNPATTYYFRARGQNAKGVGPWSAAMAGTTESGAYASINGAWVPVPFFVSNGTTWTGVAPQVSDGTEWEQAV